MARLLIVLAVLLGGTTSAASAATVRADAHTIYDEAPGGEVNRLTVTNDGPDHVFTDVVPIQPGPGCTTDLTPNSARCPAGIIANINLGQLDDEVTLDEAVSTYFVLNGGPGRDTLRGTTRQSFFVNASPTVMTGGPGRDTYVNGGGFDSVSYSDKGAGVTASLDGAANDPDGENVPPEFDALVGSPLADTLIGSDGGDFFFAGDGNDTVEGMGGDDNVGGEGGDDLVRGGAGDDLFEDEPGADRFEGGDGFDRHAVDVTDDGGRAQDVTVTIDDVANDGEAGESDDIRTDVEDVGALGGGNSGRATLVGDADVNVLTGGPGNDTIDGGAGGDVLNGSGGDDVIEAREGDGDRINCGSGTDTARVDLLDEVTQCETVERVATPPPSTPNPPAALPPATADDRPPTVSFASPLDNALIGTLRPSTIVVNAADDRGVTRVSLVDDGRVVATDTTAPYAFDYVPGGDDVGRNTLVAIAVDGAEQTASAVRPVRVDRFLPTIRGIATPVRDRRAPYRFRISGALGLPRAVTAAQGCRTGSVSVQVKRGRRTISTRRAEVTRRCTFSSAVIFRDRRRLGDGRLRVTVRFLGNAVLRERTAASFGLRAG